MSQSELTDAGRHTWLKRIIHVMERTVFSVLLFLALPSVAPAEVDIPIECRVPNRPPGRCGWCSLETLGRRHCIKALYGLVDKNPSRCRPKDMEAALAARQVKYRIQARGSRSTSILTYAIRENLGAVVGFRPESSGGKGHIVTLVDFGPKQVRILDPNDADRQVRTLDSDTFMQRWDGFALVLDRPETNDQIERQAVNRRDVADQASAGHALGN